MNVTSPLKLMLIFGLLVLHLIPKDILGQPVTQTLDCNNILYRLNSDSTIFEPAGASLSSVNLLRCENGVLIAEMGSGAFKLFKANAWIDIKQLISIGANSYYLLADGSVFNTIGSHSRLGTLTGVDYLVSNDKQLVAIKGSAYHKWNGSSWTSFNPTFVPSNLSMTDEGLWFFIQSREGYDSQNDLDKREGLTLNSSGQPVMDRIPLKGKFYQFLWRIDKVSGNKVELINKVGGRKLKLGSNSQFTVQLANEDVYGTTAFKIKQGAQSLTYDEGNPAFAANDDASQDQVWLFHFNQMVSEYMLPRNSITEDAGRADYYDRMLLGPYNTTFLASHTTSDWALVNTYFIQSNIIKSVKNQAWIQGDLSNPNAGKGITRFFCYVINKNDPDKGTDIPLGADEFNVTRGVANGGSNFVVTSEEFMCRTGPAHVPSDPAYREFNHQVHEFFHVLENRLGPVNETFEAAKKDAPFVKAAEGLLKATDGTLIFENYYTRIGPNKNTESVAILGEQYFNSYYGNYYYPGNRLPDDLDEHEDVLLPFLHEYFDPNNIWFPPATLRHEFEGDLTADVPEKVLEITSSPDYLPWDTKILYSSNEMFALKINQDANMVVNIDGTDKFPWVSSNNSDSGWPGSRSGQHKIKFQDGILSIHRVSDNVEVWRSSNPQTANAKLVMNAAGHPKIVDANYNEIFPNFSAPAQEMICQNSRSGAKLTLLPKDGSTYRLQVDWNEGATFSHPNSLTLTNGNCLSCPNLGGPNPRQGTYEFEAVDANQPVRIQWGPFAKSYCGTDEITVNNTGTTPPPTPTQVMNCVNSRTGAKISLLPQDGAIIKLQVDWNEGSTFVPPNSLELTNGRCLSCPKVGGPNPKQAIYEIERIIPTENVLIEWGPFAKGYCGTDDIEVSN